MTKIVIILLFIAVNVSSAMKCYTCENNVCTKEKDASPGTQSCTISVTEKNGLKLTVTASSPTRADKCVKKTDANGVETVKCICSTDLCNKQELVDSFKAKSGGKKPEMSLVVLLGVVFVLVFKSFIY